MQNMLWIKYYLKKLTSHVVEYRLNYIPQSLWQIDYHAKDKPHHLYVVLGMWNWKVIVMIAGPGFTFCWGLRFIFLLVLSVSSQIYASSLPLNKDALVLQGKNLIYVQSIFFDELIYMSTE